MSSNEKLHTYETKPKKQKKLTKPTDNICGKWLVVIYILATMLLLLFIVSGNDAERMILTFFPLSCNAVYENFSTIITTAKEIKTI